MTRYPVFTIGHSTHTLEYFTALLQRHDVTALADVRSAPYSRYTPQFNQNILESAMKAAGIAYVFLGDRLGARTSERSCYENGRVVYARLAETALFRTGIERVVAGADEYRIAVMCAEKEPLECHRTLLIARVLAERGLDVRHILADGSIEMHDAAMDRLLDITGLSQQDMFSTRSELINEAITRQEQRTAYVERDDVPMDNTV